MGASSRAARSSRLCARLPRRRIGGRSARQPAPRRRCVRARPATFALPRRSRRDATRRRRDTHRPRSPRSPSRHAPRDAARRGHRGASHGPPAQVPALRHPRRRRPRPAVGLDRSRAARRAEVACDEASPWFSATPASSDTSNHHVASTAPTSPTDSGDSSTSGESGNPVSVLRRRRPRIRSSRGARGRDARKWRCLVSSRDPDRKHRFDPVVERHNARGCVYRVRAPETSRAKMSAREFARCASTWNERAPPLRRRRRPRDGKSGAGISPGMVAVLALAVLSPALPSPGMVAVLSPALPSSLVSLVPAGAVSRFGDSRRGLVFRARAPRVSKIRRRSRDSRRRRRARQPPPTSPPRRRLRGRGRPKPSDEKIQSARSSRPISSAAAEAARAAAAALSTTRGVNLCSAR